MRYLDRYHIKIRQHPQFTEIPIGIKRDIAIVLGKTEELKKALYNSFSMELEENSETSVEEDIANMSIVGDSVSDIQDTISVDQLDGSDSYPISSPKSDFTGVLLENYRITPELHQYICFINSVIQALFSLPRFIELLPQIDEQFGSRFQAVYDGIEHSMEWLRSMLLENPRNKDFQLGRQCDSFELLTALLAHFRLNSFLNFKINQFENVLCKNCKATFSRQCDDNNLLDGILQIWKHLHNVESLQELLNSYMVDLRNKVDLKKEKCPTCNKISYMKIQKSLEIGEIFIFKVEWHDEKNNLVYNESGLLVAPNLVVNGKVMSIKCIIHHSGEWDNGHHESTLRADNKWINRSDMDATDDVNPPKYPYLVFCVINNNPENPQPAKNVQCEFCNKTILFANIKKHQKTKACLKAKNAQKQQDKEKSLTYSEDCVSNKVMCQFCQVKVHPDSLSKHQVSKSCLKAQGKHKATECSNRERKAKGIANENILFDVISINENDAQIAAEKNKKNVDHFRTNQTMDEYIISKEKDRTRKVTQKQSSEKRLFIKKSQFDVHDSDIFDVLDFKVPSLLDQPPCSNCGALKYPDNIERAGFCCNQGKFSINLPDIPDVLKDKLKNDKSFKKHIRKYNNSLALCSWGVDNPNAKSWPNLKFQGRVYHSLGAVHPEKGEKRKWAQMYIHDGTAEQEAQERMDMQLDSHQMDKHTLLQLQNMLHQVNPYISDFKTMGEIPEDKVANIKFVLKKDGKPSQEHARKFNLPTCQEVALIGLDDKHEAGDIQIQLRGGRVQHKDDTNVAYDPLHYVLLFPKGEPGWSYHLKQTNGRSVTPSMYYRYMLQFRDESKYFNNILRSGRLMQEYVCTQFFRIENQRLKWVRKNQTQVHADKYRGVIDAINAKDENVLPGDITVLPPTHYCSPRWYKKGLQDAMAINREYGRPHLFVTFTANAKWKSIFESIDPSLESSLDRPDVIVRIYQHYLKIFMDDLIENQVFGRIIGHVYVIEFQKRGLPHA